MIVKKHINQLGQVLVAICDSILLGKVLEEGKLQLDLSSTFFKGEEKSIEEIKEIVKRAYILNITGEESIRFALSHNLISEKNIIRISNVPHAETVIIQD